jgi:hypothetical protein
MRTNRAILFFIIILFDSCVDILDYSTVDNNQQLVVDGFITDAPGPYTVRLTKTRRSSDFLPYKTISAKSVIISDTEGNSEQLIEKDAGVYQTSPTGIRGQMGKEYFVRIELDDGKVYQSTPEKITPAGRIDTAYYEFEKVVSPKGIANYQFRIFMDSHGNSEGDNYFLWKLVGTYKVIASPELHILLRPKPVKDPRPCSGFVVIRETGMLGYVRPCECCQCWVNQVDSKANVNDNYLISNAEFKKVDMGVIPVEFWYFWEKTMVTVQQLSLSKSAYTYWKTVKDQQEGAQSLFQPSIGKVKSNIRLTTGAEEVQGYFFAASVAKKVFFLTYLDIPLGPGVIPEPPPLPTRYIPRPEDPQSLIDEYYTEPFVVRESYLLAFRHSTTQKPADWK